MASQANNQNNTRLAIPVSDEIEFKVNNMKRDESDYSENATIPQYSKKITIVMNKYNQQHRLKLYKEKICRIIVIHR